MLAERKDLKKLLVVKVDDITGNKIKNNKDTTLVHIQSLSDSLMAEILKFFFRENSVFTVPQNLS